MVVKILIAIGVILAILFVAFVVAFAVAICKLAYYTTEEFERW